MSKGKYSVMRMAAVAGLAGAVIVTTGLTSRAEETAVNNTQIAIQSGSAAVQAGSFEQAVAHYSVALEDEALPPATAAITLLNRGLSYQRLGKLVEAIADYDYALQQNALTPSIRAVALYNRGLAHRLLYRTTLALEDFTNALILNPRFAQAYNSRGNVLRELGYYGTAIEDYDAAVRYQHPQAHIPLYGKALSHAAMSDVASANVSLTRALSLQPEYAPAKELMARLAPALDSDTGTTVVRSEDGAAPTGQSVEQTPAETVVARTPPPFDGTADAGQPQVQAAAAALPNSSVSTPADGIVATPAGSNEGRTTGNITAANADSVPGYTRVTVSPDRSSGETSSEGVDQQHATPTTATGQELTTASIPAGEPAAPETGYMIQISAQRDAEAARSIWNKLVDKHSDILGNLTPYIVEADLGTRGVFYRIRAGVFEERRQGERICSKLKSRRVDCFVIASNR